MIPYMNSVAQGVDPRLGSQQMGSCPRVPVRTKAKLRDAANEHMAMLEKSPERVMSFFQDPRVKYAAA